MSDVPEPVGVPMTPDGPSSLWETKFDADNEEDADLSNSNFLHSKTPRASRGRQGLPGSRAAAASDDDAEVGAEGVAIRVAIPKEGSDKLYIRVREDAISKAVIITHFDRQPNGQPGPLEASGLVRVGDQLVGVNSADVKGRDVRSILALLRSAGGPDIVLTFLRRPRDPSRPVHITEQDKILILRRLMGAPQIDGEHLRFVASRGLPEAENVRPLVWRLLLQCLPLDRSVWKGHLETQRALYAQFKHDLTLDNTDNTEEATPNPLLLAVVQSAGGPTTPTSGSGERVGQEASTGEPPFSPLSPSRVALCHVRHVGDAELCDEIKKDVLRTHPDLQFFLDPHKGGARYAALLRCLFLYAKLNPGVRYVQGMNEVVGTLYYVLASDADATWAQHAEADAFFCFTHLMSELRDLFIQNLDETDHGIEGKIGRMVEMLRVHDRELATHMDALGLDARYYSLRWITTLLSREFNLADTIRLWDSLFAEPPLRRGETVLYCCIAMLLEQREALLAGDFAANLRLLQDYPPVDVQRLLDRMYALREYDRRRTEGPGGGHSPNRFQRFLRQVATQMEGLEVSSLGLALRGGQTDPAPPSTSPPLPPMEADFPGDPPSVRVTPTGVSTSTVTPRVMMSDEQRHKLQAAGTQLRTSLVSAAGNVRKLWGSASAVTATNGQALVSNLLHAMHTRQGSGGEGPTEETQKQEAGEGQGQGGEAGQEEDERRAEGEGEREGEGEGRADLSGTVQVVEEAAALVAQMEGRQATPLEGRQAPQTVEEEGGGEEGGQGGLELEVKEKAAVVAVEGVDV